MGYQLSDSQCLCAALNAAGGATSCPVSGGRAGRAASVKSLNFPNAPRRCVLWALKLGSFTAGERQSAAEGKSSEWRNGMDSTVCGNNSVLRAFAIAIVALAVSLALTAQTLTTGGISGTVTDPSGAAVPNAVITVTGVGNGVTRNITANTSGQYVAPQLTPGNYMINVKAAGFQPATFGPIAVVTSSVATVPITLKVGTSTQTVQVNAAAAIIDTDNPNTTTTLNAQTIENTPNPGNDLSYESQVAPGAVMNTSGGYGNVEYNGLPAVSNNFTIDGADANDPFLNLNNSGATNLQLGLNDVQEVAINTTSYSVDQGRLGAAQINFTSKSGTNQMHGNLFETYNSSGFNAADYFVNASHYPSNTAPAPKPASVVNEFGGSVGGPIVKDKLFYFFDYEGNRIALPIISSVSVPTSAYESYVLTQLPKGCTGCDPYFGNMPAEPGEVPFYQNMFKLYGPTNGTPTPFFDCPLDGGLGCINTRTVTLGNHTGDNFYAGRVDYNMGSNDTIWTKVTYEHGLQATYTDPINPIFNAQSDQPQWGGVMGWTHTFSPTLVNEFNPSVNWYSAIFEPANLSATNAAFPETYAYGPFTGLGGIDFVWPQGRNITQWQLVDNLSWTNGNHEWKFGANTRRADVSDHDLGFYTTPLLIPFDITEFTYGQSGLTFQDFPKTLNTPFAFWNSDWYAMDTWKATPKLTIIYGLRATLNTNPQSLQNAITRASTLFESMSHDPNRPITQDLSVGQSGIYGSVTPVVWQPRGAISYQFAPHTVFRMGGGVFSDLLPAGLADNMLSNPPFVVGITSGLLLGTPAAIMPGDPNSNIAYNIAAKNAFLTGFSSGAQSCVASAPPADCLPSVGLTITPNHIKYPYFEQYSMGIEQQFGTTWGLKLQYVGTHSVDIPYTEAPNGFQGLCSGCFSPWPYSATGAGPDARFGGVTEYHLGASGNYNGLQVTAEKRMSNGLQFQGNYTWSHCLDQISNGGIFGFGGPTSYTSPLPGELQREYGNCDYDIRHSFNGSYLYQLPFHAHSALGALVNGWQLSGTVFLHTGLPFSVPGANLNFFGQTSGPAYAWQIAGQNPYAKNQNLPTTPPASIQWLNPNAFSSPYNPDNKECFNANLGGYGTTAPYCQFGNVGRNTMRAPGFAWSDLFLSKYFNLSERARLRVDMQGYNIFNHPNFSYPHVGAGNPGFADTIGYFGSITSTTAPPTGLLGSFLGGDTSVRMIALAGHIEF
jgi:hypothetical protein